MLMHVILAMELERGLVHILLLYPIVTFKPDRWKYRMFIIGDGISQWSIRQAVRLHQLAHAGLRCSGYVNCLH